MAREKVVLAYSGGLDTSVLVRILTDDYRLDVIAAHVDVGEAKDPEHLKARAKKAGAICRPARWIRHSRSSLRNASATSVAISRSSTPKSMESKCPRRWKSLSRSMKTCGAARSKEGFWRTRTLWPRNRHSPGPAASRTAPIHRPLWKLVSKLDYPSHWMESVFRQRF